MYQLLNNISGEPFFANKEEYEKFRESFAKSVSDTLESYRIARQKSEYDSMFRIVD